MRVIYRDYDDTVSEFKGQFADDTHYDEIISEDADIYDASTKELVARLRKGKIGKDLIKSAIKSLESHKGKSTLRRTCGEGSEPIASNIVGYYVDGICFNAVKKRYDCPKNFRSNITAWTLDNREKFNNDIVPLISEIAEVYKTELEDKYEKHLLEANKSQFHIEGTPFSTITINRDFRTRYHTDKKNSPIGFGNFVVCESIPYVGGYLVFPNYHIAVDVREGDLLLMNQFLLHGNTPIVKSCEDVCRTSIVCYLHEDIVKDVVNNPTLSKYEEWLNRVATARKNRTIMRRTKGHEPTGSSLSSGLGL